MKKCIYSAILAVLTLACLIPVGAVDFGIFPGHPIDGSQGNDSGIFQGHIVDGVLAEDGDTDAPPSLPQVPAASFTVTFVPNGDGASVDENSKRVTNGRAYGELPVPVRSGYAFDGWRTVSGARVTANTVVNLTADQTLYAYWRVQTYKVTLDANGGTVSPGTVEVTLGGVYGDLPAPVRSGYAFGGWFTQLYGGPQIKSVSKLVRNEDHVLYAHWTALPSAEMEDYGKNTNEFMFQDVPSTSSYYQAVYWAVKRGVTSGTSPETFSPNDPCKRRHILTFLWRANGSPEPSAVLPGMDSNMWGKGMVWAYENDLIPIAYYYNDEEASTRSDAVMYLWKLAGSPTEEDALKEVLNRFSDVSPDSAYASAVAWALSAGITNGTTDTTFSPDRICTRGQIVTFLYRCYTR